MSEAKHFMEIIESLDYEEDGKYSFPSYEDAVATMRRSAVEWECEEVLGGLDPNETYTFSDSSRCVLHNPSQVAFRAYVEVL